LREAQFRVARAAGKTTTILMLMGLSVPTKGTAVVAGYDIVEDSRDVSARDA